MFLKEIKLVNFKCHEELLLSFTGNETSEGIRKTTFLLGENGTGKSALLKAIALVTAGSAALADVLGISDEWIQNDKPYCEITCTISTAKNQDRELKLRITRGHQVRGIISENDASLALLDEAITKANRNYFVVAYGASRRLNRDTDRFGNQKKQSTARSSNIMSLFNPDAALISLANWAMELDYTKKGSGLDTVRKALNDFLVENVKFKRIDREQGKLIFTTPDGDVTLEQLSDGYQNVAAWVGDLMFNITNTFKDYKEPLKARGLLLIDEIDLHLHPKWQRLLHSFIKHKLPNFQIVATTHSPLTAQQAEEGELYALKRDDNKVQIFPFKGDPSKMLIHQILMAPIFGIETDESLKIEEAKKKVRAVRLKPTATSKEKKSIKPYIDLLGKADMNERSNSLLGSEDILLLQKINNELASQSHGEIRKRRQKIRSVAMPISKSIAVPVTGSKLGLQKVEMSKMLKKESVTKITPPKTSVKKTISKKAPLLKKTGRLKK